MLILNFLSCRSAIKKPTASRGNAHMWIPFICKQSFYLLPLNNCVINPCSHLFPQHPQKQLDQSFPKLEKVGGNLQPEPHTHQQQHASSKLSQGRFHVVREDPLHPFCCALVELCEYLEMKVQATQNKLTDVCGFFQWGTLVLWKKAMAGEW